MIIDELTKREREVAELVAAGRTNKQAAGVLNVTEQTVKFHIANVYRKLGVQGRTQLASVWGGHHPVPDLSLMPSSDVSDVENAIAALRALRICRASVRLRYDRGDGLAFHSAGRIHALIETQVGVLVQLEGLRPAEAVPLEIIERIEIVGGLRESRGLDLAA